MRDLDLGTPRMEYRPLPASPISVALLMVTFLVAAIGLPLWSINRGFYGLWWLWAAPPVLVVAAIILGKPGPLRIYEAGLELPLPLWKRIPGFRGSYRYEEIVNLYPRLYYVSGALMSPFAASAGTVEHLGLGLEFKDGREAVLRFTPGVPRFSKGEEEGYRMAAGELRKIFQEMGRPWVIDVKDYSEAEVERMKRVAARPLMSFSVIVLAFFSPVAIIPLLYTALASPGAVLSPALLATIVILGVSPMLAMLLTSWRRSRRRHHYLKEISKFTEWKRGFQAPKGAT
ncbi:MAG: hypothetical protein ACE5HJ_05345 [Thermoplasmata archaeon]